jgi:hypothetical protein
MGKCGDYKQFSVLCQGCDYPDDIKCSKDNPPLAQTFINGEPAPWTPFGVEADPRKFSRSKKELCSECGLNKTFCKCKKESDDNGNNK